MASHELWGGNVHREGGAGKYLFRDVNRMNLKLIALRTFRNGKVSLTCMPA